MVKYLNHLQYAARVILITSPGDETATVLIILHNYSERKRHLTTGKRAKGLNSTSGAQFAALPLVKPLV